MRSDWKTISEPSGIQRGAEWFQSPSVSWRGVPPSAGTRKRCWKPSSM